MQGPEVAGESTKTVSVALVANVIVAAAKFIAGLLTGSAALLAEGAHSVSDTLNQGFLLTSLYRSRRPADTDHPFGYGRERFFWALLAAVGIFVAGAGFSTIEAYHSFTERGGHAGGRYFLIAYSVLAVAAVAEGTSWVRAVRQVRAEARGVGHGVLEHLRLSSDPSVKTVASEDTAALVGILLAAAGIGLHQATGAAWWEGVSAVAIALLLVLVAFMLGRDVQDLIIGEAADPHTREELCRFLEDQRGVHAVVELMTMHMGADELLVAARIDLDDGLDSADVERVSTDIDQALRQRWPEVHQVFLDATRQGTTQPGWAGQATLPDGADPPNLPETPEGAELGEGG